MLLIFDRHKAQTTDFMLESLRNQHSTSTVIVPAGATSLVQPIDVSFNPPFKAAVEKQATMHINETLDLYVKGLIPTSNRRLLLTKWVGSAWEEISSNRDLVYISFCICGISVAIDGSEDDDIHIKDLDDYRVDNDESGDSSNESDEENVDGDEDYDTSDDSKSENEGCKYNSNDDPFSDD